MKDLICKLEKNETLEKAEWVRLIAGQTPEFSAFLFKKARCQAQKYYGNRIYTRGLIEFSNYCKNDCYYCGIRRSNDRVKRYRLSEDDIMDCCAAGYKLGFRTFVLQSGEDPWFNDDRMCRIVGYIRQTYPDCAITLSLGERSAESYKRLYAAGANRYLLRHETADFSHYHTLHPKALSPKTRQSCLYNLKAIGYQVGTGMMIGSPGQTAEHLAEDLLFMKALEPSMIGIGPFIPQKDTPFGRERPGTLEQTLFLIGLIRLMLPNALIPATTALGTIDPSGREKGVLAGANVVMPNLSPLSVRKKYALYDNKICTGDEAAECRSCLQNRMRQIGYDLTVDRGDAAKK
ncbi:[FeFe] hydrogenase H-cluster radical SAM maturase HydE [Eubacterium sp.]|uniref:[FeFe] hydrogenase H-cluster radical SAM maturase HydE n=1 Tax=Eubacterium sp. TaxID=142586 RepID=UPI0026E0976C|nr:[FeFe] hydrogenase H-cluster radical SAM maturase HydE [Eubacterium sp.]MDO5433412.1 [FeFe] hydrogenase H-cluster radical SAM maturase HydE [Eubacterium sp.]